MNSGYVPRWYLRTGTEYEYQSHFLVRGRDCGLDVKVEIINVQKNGLNKGFCESGREMAGAQDPFFSLFWQQF